MPVLNQHIHCNCPESQGTLQKGREWAGEYGKIGKRPWNAVFWPQPWYHASNIKAATDASPGPAQNWGCHQSRQGWRRAFKAPELLATDRFPGRSGLSDESTRLQRTVLNQWSHRWPSLSQMSHKTRQKDMSVGRGLVARKPCPALRTYLSMACLGCLCSL